MLKRVFRKQQRRSRDCIEAFGKEEISHLKLNSDFPSYKELRERSKQEPLSEKAASRIIRWAGHVWRMDDSRIARRDNQLGRDREVINKTQDGKMPL